MMFRVTVPVEYGNKETLEESRRNTWNEKSGGRIKWKWGKIHLKENRKLTKTESVNFILRQREYRLHRVLTKCLNTFSCMANQLIKLHKEKHHTKLAFISGIQLCYSKNWLVLKMKVKWHTTSYINTLPSLDPV